jgi:hypothetical protein
MIERVSAGMCRLLRPEHRRQRLPVGHEVQRHRVHAVARVGVGEALAEEDVAAVEPNLLLELTTF